MGASVKHDMRPPLAVCNSHFALQHYLSKIFFLKKRTGLAISLSVDRIPIKSGIGLYRKDCLWCRTLRGQEEILLLSEVPIHLKTEPLNLNFLSIEKSPLKTRIQLLTQEVWEFKSSPRKEVSNLGGIVKPYCRLRSFYSLFSRLLRCIASPPGYLWQNPCSLCLSKATARELSILLPSDWTVKESAAFSLPVQ